MSTKAKVTALGLARDMIGDSESRVLTRRQTDFLRDVCAREIDNLERRKHRAEMKKGPDSRRFPVVASVGDSVWQEGGAYYISGDDRECYVVARPWGNGHARLIRSDWPKQNQFSATG